MSANKNDASDLAKDLARAWSAFSVPLRGQDGIDEEKLASLCETLRRCADEWKYLPDVPKLAANIFIDLYSAIESCSYLYDEETAERIRLVADEVADLARNCVLVEDSELE